MGEKASIHKTSQYDTATATDGCDSVAEDLPQLMKPCAGVARTRAEAAVSCLKDDVHV